LESENRQKLLKFSVRIFSLGNETFDDEFKNVKQKDQLSLIPEAILRAL